MPVTRTFSGETLALFKARGDEATLAGGYRKVSNTSYMSEDSIDSEAMVFLPDIIESVETLEFLEFRPEIAQRVYNDFLYSQNNHPERANIFYSARNYVNSIQGDPSAENDNWVGFIDRVGMSAYFKQRIMNPEYTRMRLTASAKHWIIESMTMRIGFLKNFDFLIKDSVEGSGVKRKASHLDTAGEIQPGPEKFHIPESSSQPPQQGQFKPGSSSALKSVDGECSDPTKIAVVPQAVEGCTLFYKGGDLARLCRVFGDGTYLKIPEVLSRPPCDFGSWQLGLYLSKQPAVAWEYAMWAKNLIDGGVVPIGVLAIAIPHALLENIYSVNGDDWKRLV